MPNIYSIQDFLESKSSTDAAFSPDGARVAFLSNVTGLSQLYIVDRAGGEPEQLTFGEDKIEFVTFSPIKNEIMFGMCKGGDEKTQFFLYDLATKTIRSITNKPDFIFHWGGWSNDGKSISYASNERNGADFDVYVMKLETSAARLMFDKGSWCDSCGFSPSGKKVIARQQHTFLHHDLFLIDLESGTTELLTLHEGWARYETPRWLPDERGFYFVTNEGRDFMNVSFYDLAKKKYQYVLTPNWDVDGCTLTLDGKDLAVTVNEDGYSKLTLYDTASMKPLERQSIPNGMISGVDWSNDGKFLAFTFESAVKNEDIWIWSKDENKAWQLTHSPRKVPEDIFVEPELIHYTSFDGLTIPAFLFLPKNRTGKVPAIVHVHGGPEEQFRPEFYPSTQYYVHRGYALIAPNVRGSSGYGSKYLALDDREKRMDSVKDIASLHAYLGTRDEIDSSKIALMGGSYGGYMTLAGLTFYPDLWAAGVDIVGFSNLVTFLENTSSWRRALREAEYGYLATDRKMLESISPLNFLQNVKAPLFIIHGKNDPRVPLSEAEQMASQLKALGRDVELRVYDDEGHGLSKLKNKLDAYPKVADFLDKHLRTTQV